MNPGRVSARCMTPRETTLADLKCCFRKERTRSRSQAKSLERRSQHCSFGHDPGPLLCNIHDENSTGESHGAIESARPDEYTTDRVATGVGGQTAAAPREREG